MAGIGIATDKIVGDHKERFAATVLVTDGGGTQVASATTTLEHGAVVTLPDGTYTFTPQPQDGLTSAPHTKLCVGKTSVTFDYS